MSNKKENLKKKENTTEKHHLINYKTIWHLGAITHNYEHISIIDKIGHKKLNKD